MLRFSVYHVCIWNWKQQNNKNKIKLFKVWRQSNNNCSDILYALLGSLFGLEHMRVIVRRHQHLPIFKQISKYKINELSTAENVLISCRLGCCFFFCLLSVTDFLPKIVTQLINCTTFAMKQSFLDFCFSNRNKNN